MNFDEFDSFVEDFLDEKSERPITIVASSKIDDLLLSILKKYLLPKISGGGQDDELLEGDRPLATFSSRIKILYRVGVIDISLVKVLEQVRKIRNLSAHGIAFNMKNPPIREHLAEIKKTIRNRSTFNLIKNRFFEGNLDSSIKEVQCLFITICAILEAIHEKTKQSTGIKKTLKISTN
jgi:hypothetical protein